MKKNKKIKNLSYGRQFINASDVAAVSNILRSDFLTQGSTIERFENIVASYCDARYAIAVSSGTAALHAACFAAGIQEGDEVITAPLTFVASANCVLYCGGKPVFADVRKDLPLIDPKEIEKKITKKTRAIIPIDYAGIPSDYQEINRIAKKYNLLIIADSAHSFGAIYHDKKVGTLADMTVFSFHPVKLITTGEGGMVVTDNKKFYERLKLFRTHGITKNKKLLHHKNEGSWYYEMQQLGYNYRLTDIQAALGISQMGKIDVFLQKRKTIIKEYYRSLHNNPYMQLPTIPSDRISAWHLLPIQLNLKRLKVGRKEIFKKLHAYGIKVQVHYIPIHLHPYYRAQFGYKKGDFPHAEEFYALELSLPLYVLLTMQDIRYIVEVFQKVFKQFAR